MDYQWQFFIEIQEKHCIRFYGVGNKVKKKKTKTRVYSPSAVDGLDATSAAANDRHSTACNMIHVRAHTVRHRAATPPTVVKNENDITTATIVSRRIGMFTRRKEITKKKKKKKKKRSLFRSQNHLLSPSSEPLLSSVRCTSTH